MAIKKWLLKELPDWATDVPYQIKGMAVFDACEAVKMCKRKNKERNGNNKARFRSRKSPMQTIFMPKSAIRNDGFYKRSLGVMKFAEQFNGADCDSRLTFRQGRWFLSVPEKATQVDAENQGRVVALDPGIRTFQTFYSADSCGKVGCGDFARIYRLCLHLDSLISKTSSARSKQKQRLKKAANRMRWKVRDLISELHNKTALFFVRNFDVVLIPTFETSDMARKNGRKIRAKSVRSMLSFAHYTFKQKLKFKAWEYGKTVFEVSEAYTSKTCSWNGAMKKIGGAKFIKDGDVKLDRDINGARGILLSSCFGRFALAELNSVSIC